MDNIVLIGMGGHARSVSDSIERMGKYNIIGYTDINRSIDDNGYEYLGTDENLRGILDSGTKNAVIAVGQMEPDCVRRRLYEKLKEMGYELPVIVDPSAIVSDRVCLGEGTFVGKGAIINSNTTIGKMSIINTGAVCEHDNVIGDFCHIAVRTVLCGGVVVGDNSFIGANSSVIQGVTIGKEAVIGAGSVVLHNVLDAEKRYGIV